MSVLQKVFNGLLGSYIVRTTQAASDNANIQHVRIDLGAGTAESVAAGTLPVSGTVTQVGNSTATLSNVSASASSVTLLTANSSRRGATVHNDSSAVLYLKFGTTASTSSYTVKMVADAYFEVPYQYTGRVDGIWASATGAARLTEITA